MLLTGAQVSECGVGKSHSIRASGKELEHAANTNQLVAGRVSPGNAENLANSQVVRCHQAKPAQRFFEIERKVCDMQTGGDFSERPVVL